MQPVLEPGCAPRRPRRREAVEENLRASVRRRVQEADWNQLTLMGRSGRPDQRAIFPFRVSGGIDEVHARNCIRSHARVRPAGICPGKSQQIIPPRRRTAPRRIKAPHKRQTTIVITLTGPATLMLRTSITARPGLVTIPAPTILATIWRPWAHGHFRGGFGPIHEWLLTRGRAFAVLVQRMVLVCCRMLTSPSATDGSGTRMRSSSTGDPDHIGWYLAYNVRLGTYVHVMFLGM